MPFIIISVSLFIGLVAIVLYLTRAEMVRENEQTPEAEFVYYLPFSEELIIAPVVYTKNPAAVFLGAL